MGKKHEYDSVSNIFRTRLTRGRGGGCAYAAVFRAVRFQGC